MVHLVHYASTRSTNLEDIVLIYNCWDDGLGQTGSTLLWLAGMNLFQNHNTTQLPRLYMSFYLKLVALPSCSINGVMYLFYGMFPQPALHNFT